MHTVVAASQVLSVLASVEEALVSSTTGWPELLVAQLLHVYPGLRPQVRLSSVLICPCEEDVLLSSTTNRAGMDA